MSIIYLFIDGIGIGDNSPLKNPFSIYAQNILQVCTGNFNFELTYREKFKIYVIDPSMGIAGLPQSATGQTSLWTGINASKVLGFHLTGFPGPILRNIINQHSIIKKFKENHLKASLINAYSHEFLKKLEKLPRFASASTLVQKASGQEVFTIDAILEKKAIYMDITHQIMHEYYPKTKEKFPIMDPFERGKDLVEIAKKYDLVIFEYFLSDKAGHNQSFEASRFIINILEKFIQGIIENLRDEDTLLITSDHGNMEDLQTKTHTKNLVPLIVAGNLKKDFRNVHYLYEIPQKLYEIFGIKFEKKEYFQNDFLPQENKLEIEKTLKMTII